MTPASNNHLSAAETATKLTRSYLLFWIIPLLCLVLTGLTFFAFLYAQKFNQTYFDFLWQKTFLYLWRLFLSLFVLSLLTWILARHSQKINRFLTRMVPNLLIFCFALLLALGSAELIARRAYPPQYVIYELQDIHRVSPFKDVVYELKPSTKQQFFYKDQNELINYQINSLGLRGPEISSHKPPGTFRILVLGDSVTFGVRIDQANIYTARLEQLLNQWAQSNQKTLKIEVLNPSTCGWNTFQEVSYLKHYASQLQPDLILLQFSMNDIDDPLVHMGTTIFYHIKELPPEYFPAPPGDSLRNNIITRTPADITFAELIHSLGSRYSRFYALGESALTRLKQKIQRQTPSQKLWLSWCVEKLADPNATENTWLRRQFNRLNRICAALNLPNCTVVIFPLSYQLNTTNHIYLSAIENVKRLAQSENLPVLDLTPAFSQVSQNDQFYLYLPYDASHLNKRGHQYVAELLQKYLVDTYLSRLNGE